MQQARKQLLYPKNADLTQVAFECPRCHWILRSEKPDSVHPFPCVGQPSEISVGNDVVKQDFICRNPKCKLAFAVYWSDPTDFFNRI